MAMLAYVMAADLAAIDVPPAVVATDAASSAPLAPFPSEPAFPNGGWKAVPLLAPLALRLAAEPPLLSVEEAFCLAGEELL